jgi:7-cyano-7-deazaguanine synthase
MKAVVIVSGGMDSTTTLYQAIEDGYEPFVLSFNYGQRHVKELESAKAICKRLGVSHKIIDMSFLRELLSNSALTSGTIDAVPEGHYAAENMKATVVPNRNMIMVSVGIGYAVNIGAKALYLGIHAGDHAIYPDCRPQFTSVMETAAFIANDGFISKDFKLSSPFQRVPKNTIVEIGTQLGVPFELTWSCYKGLEKHCGRCGTCVERKEAFSLAGIPDPTEYFNDTPDTKVLKEDDGTK